MNSTNRPLRTFSHTLGQLLGAFLSGNRDIGSCTPDNGSSFVGSLASRRCIPEDCDEGEGIERLRQAIERFHCHQGEYQTHMVFGKLTREQWTHQQLWHCEHHLSFLLPK